MTGLPEGPGPVWVSTGALSIVLVGLTLTGKA
jgi:hypothetical protein